MTDLDALCRDRPLATPELHGGNDFYGHAAILKDYVSWERRRSLRVAVEHGMGFSDAFWSSDLHTVMPVFLCANGRRAAVYERLAGKQAMAIGPLLHYAMGPAGLAPRPPAGRRCLVAFPAHSTHRVNAEFDAHAFAGRLRDVGRAFDDVVVCVYWRDVQRGLHRVFGAEGFGCVSAGHMYDPAFLPRLVRILGRATGAVSNQAGTSMLYAALMGVPVWIERQPLRHVAPLDTLEQDAPDQPLLHEIGHLFGEPRSDLSPAQRAFVDGFTGREHIRSPTEMDALLTEADGRYRRDTGILRKLRLQTLPHRVRYFGGRTAGWLRRVSPGRRAPGPEPEPS